ncbi:hypothetical protein B0H66DRAFT_348882 [Apodospora peruviana]|uniref:Uncharacterized protein n=1 Tax=Apodospora peruviana TaxID=516989 RepID=A0AAE0HVE1_9PEZI|nr:hypothetical protein B0H66DRAFT_348882 [Apodospora peruviana]
MHQGHFIVTMVCWCPLSYPYPNTQARRLACDFDRPLNLAAEGRGARRQLCPSRAHCPPASRGVKSQGKYGDERKSSSGPSNRRQIDISTMDQGKDMWVNHFRVMLEWFHSTTRPTISAILSMLEHGQGDRSESLGSRVVQKTKAGPKAGTGVCPFIMKAVSFLSSADKEVSKAKFH